MWGWLVTARDGPVAASDLAARLASAVCAVGVVERRLAAGGFPSVHATADAATRLHAVLAAVDRGELRAVGIAIEEVRAGLVTLERALALVRRLGCC